jgi:hypothetical protein
VDYDEVPGGAIVTLRDLVNGAEIPGVGVILFEDKWYVDSPLCELLQFYLVGIDDSQAKSNLRNALATSKAYFSVHQAFTDDVGQLAAVEPNLFGTGDDPVTVSLSPKGSVCLGALSNGGSYWGVWDSATVGTQYGWGNAPLFATGCPDKIEEHGSGVWSTAGW